MLDPLIISFLVFFKRKKKKKKKAMSRTTEELVAHYGLRRVEEPKGAGLQGAERVDARVREEKPGEGDEVVLDVSLLELDSTSLRQLREEARKNGAKGPVEEGEAVAKR